MTHSFAQHVTLPCPACGQPFDAEVWLILDASERPDLLAQARGGTLHHATCPHCGKVGMVDQPTLVYRPDLPARGLGSPLIVLTGPDQNPTDEQIVALLERLRQSLGDSWRDEWLDNIAGMPVGWRPHPLPPSPRSGEGEPAGEVGAQGRAPEPPHPLPPSPPRGGEGGRG